MNLADRIKRKFSSERIYQSLKRWLILNSKEPNPSSYPFISGDTFRAAADHIFDEVSIFDAEKVKERDIVFVKISYLQKYFDSIHPHIRFPYILISHNEDTEIDDQMIKFVDDKIIKWYSQNVNVVHPKIVPIPIGLENLDHYNNGIITNFKNVRMDNASKTNRILYGFNVGTNRTERQPALEYLERSLLTEKVVGWPSPRKYLNTLSKFRFVASPPGNGIDCIRTWEAMYVGTVPIVKNSILTRFYNELGLPVLLIDDWSEILTYNEETLEQKYLELKPRFENPALFFDYWITKIKNYD